jgi:hypothetical protein
VFAFSLIQSLIALSKSEMAGLYLADAGQLYQTTTARQTQYSVVGA